MSAQSKTVNRSYAVFAYGTAAYVLFVATFLYVIGFLANAMVPRSIDTGATARLPAALLINSGLLGLFVIQHTIMARPAFKAWWTRFIPASAERSTFVLVTCLILILMCWQWRAIPVVVWHFDDHIIRTALYALFAAGFGLVLYSSFLIDHFDLFGLRQVVLQLKGQPYTSPGFAKPYLYRLVRNPLMLGFVIAFWSAPTMTVGRLQFAVMTTGYIFLGVWFEERDLLKKLGPDYAAYRASTPMLIPRIPARDRAVVAGQV